MTDQTAHDVTDDDRRRARKWAESIEAATNSVESTTNPWSDRARAAARVILHAVPVPPPPTLADMNEEERRACKWMQCEVRGERRIITLVSDDDNHSDAVTLAPSGYFYLCSLEIVTPLPDLPRVEWPGDKQAAPAPTLPDGWRLADHQEYGRVIVTNPTPNRDGHVYFVLPVDDPMGYDWHLCFPGELAYIDQEDDQ